MVANLLVEIWSGKNVEEQGEKEGKETLEGERVRGDCIKLINIRYTYSHIDVNIYTCIYQMWYVKQHRSRLDRACLPGLR